MKLQPITEERRNTIKERMHRILNAPDSCDPVNRDYRAVDRLIGDLIEHFNDPRGWTTKRYVARYNHVMALWETVNFTEAKETDCFCVIGALYRQAAEYDDWTDTMRRQVPITALNELGAAVRSEYADTKAYSTLMQLNDCEGLDAVMRVLRKVKKITENYIAIHKGDDE
jgi:hypothetical protein